MCFYQIEEFFWVKSAQTNKGVVDHTLSACLPEFNEFNAMGQTQSNESFNHILLIF